MSLTPDQWLTRLTERMDLRASRLHRLRCYMDGNAPLPEGAEGCRDAYKAFQKKARTNFGELVVDAVAERMIVSGFRVGDSDQDDDAARAIWRRNRLAIGSSDAHRDMLGLSHGYTMIQRNPDGSAMVTTERPEQVITEHDPRRPDQVQAGLKVYRDSVVGMDYAFVHIPGGFATYRRMAFTSTIYCDPKLRWFEGGWEQIDEKPTGLSVVPIVPLVNRGGIGEFESHLDLLDRINWGILQRLVTTAMQAYRQRATKGDMPDEDAEGNEIDYGEMFKPGPGALWRLPEGVDLWESQQTDFTPLLSAVKDDLTHLAAVTRTPMSTLIPDGANQSAEGAAFAREGLVFKAGDRVQRAGSAWDLTMGLALAIERGQSDPVTDLETKWMPVERQSLAERADAASKAQDVPWRTRMTDIWQFPADQVDRMETERAQDLLNAALTAPQPAQVTGGNPAA